MTLEEATRALREDGAMDAARRRALRDRVLKAPKKRSLRAVRWVMPIAAVLAAASVWAAVSHERHVPAVTAPIATTAANPVPVVVPLPVIATATETAPRIVTPRVVAPPKRPVADDSERRALRAYREAEHLQFDEKDYARALEAWDRYLPLAGKSPLVVDARWQRALCLVKLGRKDEARVALAPFARGELGGYRRDEAQSLSSTLQ